MNFFKIVFIVLLFVKTIEIKSQCTGLVSSLSINSGYDYNLSNTITTGNSDDNWTIISDPDFNTLEPRKPIVIPKDGPWSNPQANSQWLSPYITNTTSCIPCKKLPYKMEYKFCLSAVSNPTLTLSILVDDSAAVLLNGTYIGQTKGSNGSPGVISTSTSSLFVSGTNVIEVDLVDIGLFGIGVNISGTLTASANTIYGKKINLNNIVVNSSTYDVSSQTITPVCTNGKVNISIQNADCYIPSMPTNSVLTWDFGDGTSATGVGVSHVYTSPGTFSISLNTTFTNVTCGTPFAITITDCGSEICTKCISSFAPDPGDYILSLWVKEDLSSAVKTYTGAGVEVSFGNSTIVYGPLYPQPSQNRIIDGWQRIEEKFTVPTAATDIKLSLVNQASSTAAYFDDIRIHPVDGNMKSYVYDPITLRLVAELDENNYATLYEYNEEGQLIRVKKETEKGVVTIKETRSANKKQ